MSSSKPPRCDTCGQLVPEPEYDRVFREVLWYLHTVDSHPRGNHVLGKRMEYDLRPGLTDTCWECHKGMLTHNTPTFNEIMDHLKSKYPSYRPEGLWNGSFRRMEFTLYYPEE